MLVPGSIPNIILSLVTIRKLKRINCKNYFLKSNKLYKYINLLLRIIIGIIAVYFIYTRVESSFLINLNNLDEKGLNYTFLFLAFILLFLNWGIEAVKWKYTIRNDKVVSIVKAFKLTITGITVGLLTPNRIGEIPARAMLLDKKIFKQLVLKTGVSSFSQLLITMLFGVVGLILTADMFATSINFIGWIIGLTIGVVLLFLVYFRTNKLNLVFNKIKFIREKKIVESLSEFSILELGNILLMSALRYVVFVLQYYLVLKAFNISLLGIDELFLIPVCFMIASFIPTILISEIGVRGSVALFVFGIVSDMDIQIVLASITLWMINVALPALLGLFNLNELKILKED